MTAHQYPGAAVDQVVTDTLDGSPKGSADPDTVRQHHCSGVCQSSGRHKKSSSVTGGCSHHAIGGKVCSSSVHHTHSRRQTGNWIISAIRGWIRASVPYIRRCFINSAFTGGCQTWIFWHPASIRRFHGAWQDRWILWCMRWMCWWSGTTHLHLPSPLITRLLRRIETEGIPVTLVTQDWPFHQ